MAIITLTDLAPWTTFTAAELADHSLAQKVVDHASVLVNDEAQQNWSLDDPDHQPPPIAKIIVEALAARTFNNPRVVEQRSTGPMSERLASAVLTGMALRPDEIERLAQFRTDDDASDGAGRLWVWDTAGPAEPTQDETVVYLYAGMASRIAFAKPRFRHG